MKISLLVLFIPFILWGASYETALMQIGAKIFPKIVVMEKGTKERIKTNITLVIVASASNKDAAQKFAGMIERQYGNGIDSRPLKLYVLSPKEALEVHNVQGYVLFLDSTDMMLEKLIKHAHDDLTLTFALDSALLQNGTDISLSIGRSIKPYINLSTFKQVPFTFEYGFLKLSQPY